MQGNQYLATPEELGLNRGRLLELIARARKEVDDGLLPSAQIAVARNGKLGLFETYGDATNDSLYCIFSATKAITSATAWLLIADGRLDIQRKVAEIVPEFADNGKENITIEQLFLHTAGFPSAPFRPTDWLDKSRRKERYSSWRLTFEPGTRYEYHPTSSMWIIAEIIERLTLRDFDEFVRNEIALPLGLGDLWVGTPDEVHARIATISHVGSPLTEMDYKEMGFPIPPITEVTPAAIAAYNTPETRRIPVPGGGGIMSAAELALFYQGLIGQNISGEKLWSKETINLVTEPRTGELIDNLTGSAINRGLGVIIAGDSKRNHRGFGHTNSASTFGHKGAGGQIAWVDPASGISFAYCTNGHDLNSIRQARRDISISNKAAVCAD